MIRQSLEIDRQTALIAVDVQKDFCPGGALSVPDGDRVVPVLNRYIGVFRRVGAPIIATRDWHPSDHCSFQSQGGPWPVHCVQGSKGAEFHPQLELPEEAVVFSKGDDKKRDAYSGFQGTNLKDHLSEKGIRRILVGGLATDYCVKNTVLDGLKNGFEVYFLADASRAVNIHPEDGEKAEQECLAAGAKMLKFQFLSRQS